jgi:hypothetical protein
MHDPIIRRIGQSDSPYWVPVTMDPVSTVMASSFLNCPDGAGARGGSGSTVAVSRSWTRRARASSSTSAAIRSMTGSGEDRNSRWRRGWVHIPEPANSPDAGQRTGGHLALVRLRCSRPSVPAASRLAPSQAIRTTVRPFPAFASIAARRSTRYATDAQVYMGVEEPPDTETDPGHAKRATTAEQTEP